MEDGKDKGIGMRSLKRALLFAAVLTSSAPSLAGAQQIGAVTVDIAGNQITIEGVGFGGDPMVTFDNQSLSLLSSSDSKITARLERAPPAGTHLLTVVGGPSTLLFDVTIGSPVPAAPLGARGSQGRRG